MLDSIQGHVSLRARLPMMLMQIKETRAAASHRAKYNNAAALQAESFLLWLEYINIQKREKTPALHVTIPNC